jgi:hypothetical protein
LGVRFSISVPRSSAMWAALERLEQDVWEPADGLADADGGRPTFCVSALGGL